MLKHRVMAPYLPDQRVDIRLIRFARADRRRVDRLPEQDAQRADDTFAERGWVVAAFEHQHDLGLADRARAIDQALGQRGVAAGCDGEWPERIGPMAIVPGRYQNELWSKSVQRGEDVRVLDRLMLSLGEPTASAGT